MSPSAPFVAPPLRLWGKTWRMLLALLVGVVALGAVLSESTPSDGQVGLDLLAGVVALCLLPLRRRAPVAVALVITALSAVSSMSVGALLLVTVSLATRRRWREVLPVAASWFVASWVYEARAAPYEPVSWWLLMIATAAVLVPTVLTGFYIGGRRELMAVLQARAETAEREQAARVAQARTAERAAIAREMHDVLAHRISLVAMHSGALAFRTDLTADQTTEVATVIRDNAHLALTELREVLGVLRASGSDQSGAPASTAWPPTAEAPAAGPAGTAPPGTVADDTGRAGAPVPELPQPTIAGLGDLVDDARAAGTPVTLHVTPDPVDLAQLSASTGRTIYRIVQEALTNARKHAPGRPVTITLDGSPDDGLRLVLHNPTDTRPAGHDPGSTRTAALPASGLGLAGLSERATLAGGSLEHGLDTAGTFVVRAWVPWTT